MLFVIVIQLIGITLNLWLEPQNSAYQASFLWNSLTEICKILHYKHLHVLISSSEFTKAFLTKSYDDLPKLQLCHKNFTLYNINRSLGLNAIQLSNDRCYFISKTIARCYRLHIPYAQPIINSVASFLFISHMSKIHKYGIYNIDIICYLFSQIS